MATGLGSMPGEDIVESVRVVAGELPELPYLPELPARGAIATMTGRTLAVVPELGFDLQPAGWRLTDASGVDHRRARSLLARDLDALEERLQGHVGPIKVQLAGPWTLAATVERPRGDRVLADVGARRELAEALALGVTEHLADLRRRVPGAEPILQIDEPALPGVLAGRVPTASGFHRHRSVDAARASAALEAVFAAVIGTGATPIAHCCAAEVPIGLLRGAGARAVAVDLDVLPAAAYDELGVALDAGESLWLGVVAVADAAGSADPVTAERVRGRVRRFLGMLGYSEEEVSDRLVLTPACGLAGATPDYVRAALAALHEAAG